MPSRSPIERHYNAQGAGLVERVLGALRDAGKDPESLTLDDLAPMDEFHIRGRHATRELAAMAGISAADRVLDVGCGIGGPSRYLAGTFGCGVTGMDLVEEYCRVAEVLARGTGLKESVEYRQGDALAMPFTDGAFDVAWTQHSTMNIQDKTGLYREIRRVLKQGGRLAMYEVVQGAGGELRYPVPWARDPSISFLMTAAEVRETLEQAGFRVCEWQDGTATALEWFRATVARRSAGGDAPKLGLHAVLGPEIRQMGMNMALNLEEGRIGVAQAVLLRPEG
ncbi:MAG: methyltransferase domain-containing protein [bacterium]